MKKNINLAGLAIALLLLLPSCMHQINKNNLSKISLGMSKTQVASCLGKPYVSRGAHVQSDGTLWEVWEYIVFQPWQGAVTYFLYFSDHKLVQYGQPGDFQKPADHVQEFRVR